MKRRRRKSMNSWKKSLKVPFRRSSQRLQRDRRSRTGPIIEPTFDSCLLAVSSLASGVPNFHGLTGGNRLTGFKMAGRITDGYLQRSDAFFADLFSRMNDGVIVLVGSMEDYLVKKVLQNHIGGFRTSRRVVSKEPMNYQPLSGCTTHVVDADRNGILTAMSIEMPLTIDTYMTTSLAAMLLKQKVAEALSDAGMYMTLSSNVRIYPHERASVMMAVRGGDDPVEGITVLRSVLSDVSARKWTDADLKLCKADLKNAVAMKMKTPEYWTEVLIMRYLYGKDLSTGYAARIDAVTAENVCRVLQAWNSGSKVEYIMKKR